AACSATWARPSRANTACTAATIRSGGAALAPPSIALSTSGSTGSPRAAAESPSALTAATTPAGTRPASRPATGCCAVAVTPSASEGAARRSTTSAVLTARALPRPRRRRASENEHEDGRRSERRAEDPWTEPETDLPRFREPVPPASGRRSDHPLSHLGHHARLERGRQRHRSAIHGAEQPLSRPRLGVKLRRQIGEAQLAVEKPLDQRMKHRRHSTSLSRSRS